MIDHFTLKVKNLEVPKAFYQAALAAGGKDNGAPSERKNYHVGILCGLCDRPRREQH